MSEYKKDYKLKQVLGTGKGAVSMVSVQQQRNQKLLNPGQTTEHQERVKQIGSRVSFGLGRKSNDMTVGQSRRNTKLRGHGELDLDTALNITAEVLIRQHGRCWVTGNHLEINGYCDSIRSYSIDRLDDSRGYSVANCRAVCIWVNTATTRCPKPEQKIQLWRGFQLMQLGSAHCSTTDFYPTFSDRGEFQSQICAPNWNQVTRDRAKTWLPFFDLPPIAPFSALKNEEVLALITG